jgi:hypothetical protein
MQASSLDREQASGARRIGEVRSGWKVVLRQWLAEWQACADSGRSRDDDRSAQIDPKWALTACGRDGQFDIPPISGWRRTYMDNPARATRLLEK